MEFQPEIIKPQPPKEGDVGELKQELLQLWEDYCRSPTFETAEKARGLYRELSQRLGSEGMNKLVEELESIEGKIKREFEERQERERIKEIINIESEENVEQIRASLENFRVNLHQLMDALRFLKDKAFLFLKLFSDNKEIYQRMYEYIASIVEPIYKKLQSLVEETKASREKINFLSSLDDSTRNKVKSLGSLLGIEVLSQIEPPIYINQSAVFMLWAVVLGDIKSTPTASGSYIIEGLHNLLDYERRLKEIINNEESLNKIKEDIKNSGNQVAEKIEETEKSYDSLIQVLQSVRGGRENLIDGFIYGYLNVNTNMTLQKWLHELEGYVKRL
jgi:hypothetical protein